MKELSEAQFMTLREYTGLLTTIATALDYVVESFDNYEKTEGDRLLGDVFAAFSQIVETNNSLKEWFKDQPVLLENIMQFDNVVESVNQLEAIFSNSEKRHTHIKEYIVPSFNHWAINMESNLKAYTQS